MAIILNRNQFSGNIFVQFVDHFSQFLSINKEINKLKPKIIIRRDLSNFDEKVFIDDISIQNRNANNYADTNLKFNNFLWSVEDCVERHAPIKKLNKNQVKRSMKPWITNEIINMIGHRDRLFHQKKDNPPNQRIKSAYNLFRNHVTREIKKAKNSIIMITLKII